MFEGAGFERQIYRAGYRGIMGTGEQSAFASGCFTTWDGGGVISS